MATGTWKTYEKNLEAFLEELGRSEGVVLSLTTIHGPDYPKIGPTLCDIDPGAVDLDASTLPERQPAMAELYRETE